MPEEPDAAVLSDVKGHVSLQDVSFSYDPDRPLIGGLNLSVKPGQRIAIVGPTGCGKTTLINLLMRFYDVDGGAIAVEGEDIRTVTRRSLRSSYGMVLQETWLKTGTIRENIKMGRPDATDDEMIEAAAKASHAHGLFAACRRDTIRSSPRDGGSLSQGQKQLLCIARVMLCRPPMLILDEATSSIDTRTELKVQEAFESPHARPHHLHRGAPAFPPSGRRIRSLSCAMGTSWSRDAMRELLKKGGFYAELYNSQFAH